jgi:outer membrane protein OmpA-like peptidoglycan-associated protein
MRRQRSKIGGTPLGPAIAVTLLCWSSCLAPSSAQSPKADGATPPPASLPDSKRDETRPIASEPPAVTLDLRFDDNLSDDTLGSNPQIAELAKTLSSQDLKRSTFVIACHEMDSGHPEADQALAVRCAETVKRVLVEKFGLAADALVAVGLGSSKSNNPANPASTKSHRIEILKMGVARPAVSR